ncbi:hypothetical protein AFLA_001796 [Aspergillus flavus NRRL3357]|nr:hypothetical protein AFLA_001796 [Aspergillus flavus NRRL3357]
MQRDAVGRVEKDEISRVDTSKETRSSSHGPCCRSQTSLADGRSWFLDDAYPDIESSAALHARDVRAFEPTAIIRCSLSKLFNSMRIVCHLRVLKYSQWRV